MPASIPNDIYQYSVHAAYKAGLQTGGPPIAFLTNHGTYGFGYLEDGTEVVQMNSTAWLFTAEGKAKKASMDQQLPFVMVCVFEAHNRIMVDGGGDTMANLKDTFHNKGRTGQDGRNTPMPFAVRGAFTSLKTTHETMENVQGTIFGYSIPPWQESVSGPTIQCCFLSGDHAKGGKVVDFESTHGTFVEWARTGRFHLGFPQEVEFETMKF